MRICMISSEYPPKWGGVGVVTYYLSNWLAKKGHEVHVVTREQKIGYLNSRNNIHIHPVKWLRVPMLFTTSFGGNAVKWVKDSGLDFDLVHVHSNMALLKRKHYDMIDAPIVSTMYGTWVGERSKISLKDLTFDISAINDLAILFLSPFFDRYEDLALKRSKGVIAISRAECRALSERSVKDTCKRRVLVYPGIDVEEFDPGKMDPSIKERYGIDPDDKIIISVGRWAARKGIRETVTAFEMMIEKRSDLSLVLVGWGPLGKEIERRARKKNLQSKIHLLESLPFKDMQALVATADLGMFHSYWEGFGLTFGEALASGTPIVVTDVGGAFDMVAEGTGKLIEVGDIKGQAEAALEILNRKDIEEMGTKGRKHIEKTFSWSVISRQTEELYKWVVEDPDGREKCRAGLTMCRDTY